MTRYAEVNTIIFQMTSSKSWQSVCLFNHLVNIQKPYHSILQLGKQRSALKILHQIHIKTFGDISHQLNELALSLIRILPGPFVQYFSSLTRSIPFKVDGCLGYVAAKSNSHTIK